MEQPAAAPAAPHGNSPGYSLFMLVLCVYSLAALAIQSTTLLRPETSRIVDYADYVVCAIFMVDFVISLARAPNRWRYLMTWGWLDLLSSFPTFDIGRWGRVARVVRVVRVLRGFAATERIATAILRRRTQSSVLAASLIALLLVIFCSVAMLHVESRSDANIRTAEDALWWALSTLSTVGYGDRFPVTGQGRLVAAVLMTAGVGIFATFSGGLAAWFLGGDNEGQSDTELAALRAEVAAVRVALENLETEHKQGQP